MDDLLNKFKSVYVHSNQVTSKKQVILIIPPYIEHAIDYNTSAKSETRSFCIKNNSESCMTIVGSLGMQLCRQIVIYVKTEPPLKISKSFQFVLQSGKSIEFDVTFNPKFPGFDSQIITFKDENMHSNSITLKMDCKITQQLTSLVPSSEPPSNCDIVYYIPPSDVVVAKRPRGPMINKLTSPKYCGNIENTRFIEMALNGNFESLYDLFKPGLTPSSYKSQMEIALRLDYAVGQIEISAHDRHSLEPEYEGDFIVLKLPGIVDEDYIIGPGANSIYLEYYSGETLRLTCMCEYGKIDKSEGIVRIKPPIYPSNVAGITRIGLRIKQSIIPLAFSLYGLDQLTTDTINNVLFPLTFQAESRADFEAVDIRGKPSIQFYNPNLNSRQRIAVCKIVEGRYGRVPFIIFGPPGTGKTTTVIESILQIYKHIPSSVILVTAQTNKSVDNLALKLIETREIPTSEIIRFVSHIRGEEITSPLLRACSLEVIPRSRLHNLRIVCTTFVKSAVFASADGTNRFFTHLFVDEASQCAEASVVISINLLRPNGRLILAGDPYQLGPMSKLTNEKISAAISNSLLHRLIKDRIYSKISHKYEAFGGYNPVLIVKLVENYRNFYVLVNFFSKLFYENELIPRATLGDNDLCHNFKFLTNKNFPLLFHGVDGQDYLPKHSTSFVNVFEAVLVLMYISQLLSEGIPANKIAVISFYKKQAMFIRRLLFGQVGQEIECQTIEKFQGSEKTVVILTTVRTTKNHFNMNDQRYSLKFLFNPQRFNVAISRAISMLIVIGDPNVMRECSLWNELLKYCLSNNSYVGCGLSNIS